MFSPERDGHTSDGGGHFVVPAFGGISREVGNAALCLQQDLRRHPGTGRQAASSASRRVEKVLGVMRQSGQWWSNGMVRGGRMQSKSENFLMIGLKPMQFPIMMSVMAVLVVSRALRSEWQEIDADALIRAMVFNWLCVRVS
ncbi:hypothetical protein [Chachezhania sediminis]|uniref:hypothetical protein n=1 Tax=Chachezhania sediminis TaxID=2599291 RepID=UPI00131E32F2|nr:hypothetical protein [Chachezhania sediminis]